MSTQNDGGPAFPLQIHASPNSEIQEGMTLRDYFAAKAMQGMTANPSYSGCPTKIMVGHAYEAADAMLAARNSTAADAANH